MLGQGQADPEESMFGTIWEKWNWFWEAYGPWIGAALIPTIITGLSLSPKTEKAIPWINKAWDAFKKLMDVLSVLSHKDKLGTFQAPLNVKKLVEPTVDQKAKELNKLTDRREEVKKELAIVAKQEDKDPPKPDVGPLGPVAALFLVVALASQPGCSWWNSDTGKGIRQDTIDCTLESVKANAASLLPTIMAILTGDFSNWKQQITAIAKEFGADATACALRAASERLQDAIVPTAPANDEGNADAQEAILKAKSYANEQGWKYKGE